MLRSLQLIREAKKISKNTKIKFYVFTFLGLGFYLFSGFIIIKFHNRLIYEQSVILNLYKSLSNYSKKIDEIALVGQKIRNSASPIELKNLRKDFRKSNQDLENLKSDIKEYISRAPFLNNDNFYIQSTMTKFDQEVEDFQTRAEDIAKNTPGTREEKELDIEYITSSGRKNIANTLDTIEAQLHIHHNNTLKLLRTTSIYVVLFLAILVFLSWSAVFRPLYNTSKKLQDKLMDALLKTESANRSKTDFLANISHEIRTPMTAILGYSELLENKEIEESEVEPTLKTISKNARHLLDLVNDILDVSKIESGHLTLDETEIDLKKYLNEFYSLINVKAAEKEVELIFESEGKFPEKILIDEKRLTQILFNIVGNAIKFTDRGFVKLKMSHEVSSGEDHYILFKISDTGCGIPKNRWEDIFKPFEQADTTTSRKYGGTGLGLSLSSALCRKMGGDIQILESQVNQGTTMQIRVKANPASNSSLTESLTTSIQHDQKEKEYVLTSQKILKDKKILLVDDAKENLKLFSIYLRKAGATVLTSARGAEALQMIKIENKLDLVLLDLQMPEMDGYQTFEAIKSIRPALPVIALTAHAMKEERDKTKTAGFRDHIVKPVSSVDLVIKTSKIICQQV